jgi:hypothetical protein
LTVQRLAPQLVAFAGSQSNFQNLVNTSDSPIPAGATSRSPTLQTVSITAPGAPVNTPTLRH